MLICIGLAVAFLVFIFSAGFPLWANILTGAAAFGMLALGASAAWALLQMRLLRGVLGDVFVEKRPHFRIDLTIASPRGVEPLDIDDLDDLIDEIPLTPQAGSEMTLRSKRVIGVTLRGRQAKPLDAAGRVLADLLQQRGYVVDLEL